MVNEHVSATRKLGLRDGAEILAVRRARLKVTRGPDKGKVHDLGGENVVTIGTGAEAGLVLTDDSVSRAHAEICATEEGYRLVDLGSTNGTRVGGVLVRDVVIDTKSATILLGDTILELTFRSEEVERRLSLRDRFGSLVGRSAAMREVFDTLERAAPSGSTVLVLGESGTGKELVAESLHAASSRAAGPFVVLDCAALSATLAESELFGHERGAFTGAHAARAGAFEDATGGTLFLDEIGDLPLDLQPKLLRAIEARQVRRIGAPAYRDVDVRVIAATSKNLSRMVEQGSFRGDLYYRLAVVIVTLPPLRHRASDIPILARELARGMRPAASLDDGVLAAFASHAWPGNVRELKNAVERVVVMGEPPPVATTTDALAYHDARRRALDDFERDYCVALLAETGGVVARAADRAGLSRQMFHRLLKRHGIGGDP